MVLREMELKSEIPITRKGNGRRGWLGLLLWMAFGAGLLVQAFAPHLKIQNRQFVIPPSLVSKGKAPDEIVGRERKMQLLSGILTVSSALGLGFYYRHVFLRPRSS